MNVVCLGNPNVRNISLINFAESAEKTEENGTNVDKLFKKNKQKCNNLTTASRQQEEPLIPCFCRDT